MLSTQVSIWLLYVWVPTDSDVVTFLQNLKPVMENMSRLIKELEKQLRANVEKSSFDLFFSSNKHMRTVELNVTIFYRDYIRLYTEHL